MKAAREQSAHDRAVNRADDRVARQRTGAARTPDKLVIGEPESAADDRADDEP